MNNFETINLADLHNNEHFQFMTDVNVLITKLTVEELGLGERYAPFKDILSAEETTIRTELGSSISKILATIDKQRDKTWRAIDMRIKSTLLIPIDEENESASVIKAILHKYGDPRHLNYNEESSSLNSLIEDLLLPANAAEIEKIGMTLWLTKLKSLNEEFQKTFNERNLEYAGKPAGDVRTIRKQLDPAFEKILDRINAQVELNVAKPGVSTFIRELNEQIKYYNTTLASRKARGEDDDEITNTGSTSI